MISTNDVPALMGSTVNDTSGEKVGKVGQVYLDDQSGQPQWVTVSTGLFGTKESFVPVTQASFADGILTVPVAKDLVKDAPQIDQDGHITPEQEAELYRHYGLSRDDAGAQQTTSVDRDVPVVADSGQYADADRTDQAGYGSAGHDTSGPDTDSAMTRSEERLDVGTETVETGRARLRKYVTTHTENVEVPVSREEVRVVREPITDANVDDAMSGGDLTEEEHEVTLTEERPVVSKQAVPVERVRMDTETVSDTQSVTEEVRAEQIEVDDDSSRTTDTTRGTDTTTGR